MWDKFFEGEGVTGRALEAETEAFVVYMYFVS